MASSSDLKDGGLKVTVTPSQSAFFAGELFTATITFSNPAPSSNETSLHTLPSVSDLTLRSSDHLKQDSNWAQNDGSLSAGNRNIGSISAGANQGEGNPFYQQLNESKVTSSIDLYSGEDYDSLLGMVGEGSGNAIETPLSAAFNLSQNPIPRSVSGRLPSATIASSSKPTLPTRRGLIGKPLPIAVAPPTLSNHSRRVSSAGNGIYNTPRKPSAGQLHTRSQSMAVSSPNLLERELSFVKNVGKSNLGRRESTLPRKPISQTSLHID